MSEMMSILFLDPFFRVPNIVRQFVRLGQRLAAALSSSVPFSALQCLAMQNNHSLMIEVYQTDDPRTVCL